jgi:hypothetical protein
MADTGGPPRSALVRTEDALWASLPGRLWPRVPGLALLLADGGWLRARRGLGLVVPLLAFLLGLWRGAARPAAELTYGYSVVWLLVLLVVALIGSAVAAWLLLGFVLGDLFFFDHPATGFFFDQPSLWDSARQFLVPHLLSYVLLAVLLMGTPLVALLARGSVSGLLAQAPWRLRVGLAAAAAAVVAGLQAGLWTQAYPLLIRPLWTWHERLRAPDVAGIAPIQENPIWVGLVAGLAAAGWAVLSAAGLRRITGHRHQPVARPRTAGPRPSAWSVAGALVKAALVTLLLAGIVPVWWQGLLAAAVLFLAFLAQGLLLPLTPAARWWTARLPAVLRLAVAALVAWLVAWQIGRTAYDVTFGQTRITTQGFDPLLWAVVGAVAAMALLMPAVRDRPRESGGTS